LIIELILFLLFSYQETDIDVTVGTGAIACEEFVKFHDNNEKVEDIEYLKLVNTAWISGYMSALETTDNNKRIAKMEPILLYAYVVDECKNSSNLLVKDAINRVYKDLQAVD